jgi:pyruvate ferredoxin oxidoreductase alpha subunit
VSGIDLKANPMILASRNRGLVPFARAVQAASRGRIGFTLGGLRLGDRPGDRVDGLDQDRVEEFLLQVIEHPLRPGNYPLEALLALQGKGLSAGQALQAVYRSHLSFVGEDVVAVIEKRQLKVFLLGSAGAGVVSAVQDLVAAFCAAGYHARAFPLFDPSKKGAPVKGYGIISREPILSHAPFDLPDIVLLFDQKLFPLLRASLNRYGPHDPHGIAILVNTPMEPKAFRAAAGFHDPYGLYTLDADALVRGKRMPPNYAMIGGMLGLLGKEAVDADAFAGVVEASLREKFRAEDKVQANLGALARAKELVGGKAGPLSARAALGPVQTGASPEGQVVLCEEGNRAIARAVAAVFNEFPSVVAAYPITPQTAIVEYLAQMIADGELTAEGVTPESEHGAGGALMGAARDRVLAFTASSSQGLALMSEILHSIAGMRMGNVLISNVVRSLNSPLDVENDHSDLNKICLDSGCLVYMTRNVQEAYDFHLIAYLASLYAEYRGLPAARDGGDARGAGPARGALEMVPDRAVMLPTVVASEGFEVSHAPERYLALTPALVKKLYDDPFFSYVRTFVFTPNESIMGALQLSDARMDTDFQRHVAMRLAYGVLKTVFNRFEAHTGRKYDFLRGYNVEPSKVVFVVAGAANGTFEEVAREFQKKGFSVGVVHPNVLRPFPKDEWAEVLRGRRVFVYDRDDPYGAVGGRLYTELAGVVNEYGLASTGTRLYSRIYGLGGRTPSLSLACGEVLKALREQAGELALSAEKQYVGVNI